MNEAARNKCVSFLALAAALLIPALLPHSAHGMYDPKHGRWLQRDPERYVDGMNLYEYVVSRPADLTDPAGTSVVGLCECEELIERAGISSWTVEDAGNGLVRFSTHHSKYRKALDARGGMSQEASEIVHRMLLSKHEFQLDKGRKASWEEHIEARERVIARTKSFSRLGIVFGRPSFNPSYWGVARLRLKAGASAFAAFQDPWSNPSAYVMGCQDAPNFILGAAWGDMVGQTVVDAAVNPGHVNFSMHEAALGSRRPQNTLKDWIPGDWGYVKNTGYVSSGATPGENIIYLSQGVFFGFGGVKEFMSLDEWVAVVDSWDSSTPNSAEVVAKRHYLKVGLVNESYGGGWERD